MIKDAQAFEDTLFKVNEWWMFSKSRKAEKYKKKRMIFSELK
jgi:hypothetical protein